MGGRVARLLMANSRSDSIVTGAGGGEFAVLLVNTPKAGAIKCGQRIDKPIRARRARSCRQAPGP